MSEVTNNEDLRGFNPIIKERIDKLRENSEFNKRVRIFLEFIQKYPNQAAELLALRENDAHVDSLTGSLTYRGFAEHSLIIIEQIKAINPEILENTWILYGDVDGLKRTNDTQKRKAGDNLLVSINDSIKEVVGGELLGRVGSDEFAILLINIKGDSVKEVYNKIMQAVEMKRRNNVIPEWSGISFGLAKVGKNTNLKEVLYNADEAMREAKDKRINTPGERGGHVDMVLIE